jgi:hypothetical protein
MGIIRLVAKIWESNGEAEYEEYNVGNRGVIKIEEHRARGEGDKWYYDVFLADGTVVREFQPVAIVSEGGG